MKKIMALVIVGLVSFCGLQAAAIPFNFDTTNIQTWQNLPQESLFYPDDLDQSQELMNWFGPIGPGPLWGFANYILAQSFTPTKNLLTKIELMVGRNSTTTYDITVAIRDDLNGSDLSSKSLPSSEIIVENFSWAEFDIPDLMVTPGDTYYIVVSTVNVTDNWYVWGFYTNGSIYPNGTVYYSIDDEATWEEEPGGDTTFRTYGTDATLLNLSITGGIGVSVSAKNDGLINADNVKTEISIQGGILGLINISAEDNTSLLLPTESLVTKTQPLGLGPMTIVATTRADNAEEVTKNQDALILLFFVIIR